MRVCWFACIFLLVPCASVHGDLVIFTLGGSLNGLSIDGASSGSLTVDGLTARLTANDGVLNATTSNFGINASGSGDATDQIDAGSGVREFITITFDAPVEFTQLSLAAFSGSERASVIVGLNSPLFLTATTAGTDVYDFTSSSFALGNRIDIGQPLVIGYAFGSVADNGFSLAGFQVSTVPEPSAAGLALLVALSNLFRRRRWCSVGCLDG